MTDLRRDILGRLDPDGGIPLSRWQHSNLVKELVYPREEIYSVFGLVCHVVKYLQRRVEIQCKPELKWKKKKKRNQTTFFLLLPHLSLVWPWICQSHGIGDLSRVGPKAGKETLNEKKKRKGKWHCEINSSVTSLTSAFMRLFYLVGTGTSVRPVMRTAGDSRTKAMMGFSRKSTSPTSTLEASAPGGIFFMKFMST